MHKSWANLVLGLQSQSLLHVLSYPWATIVSSPRYKILVCRRLTLGYGLPIVFFCFAFGYPWATFALSFHFEPFHVFLVVAFPLVV